MLLVDGAAEPFDAVVRAVVDLDIVDGRAGADARQSDAVQLIARRNLEARIADLHVADAVAIVVGRGAAEKGVARSAFDRNLDRKSTRLNSSPYCASRMLTSAWKKKNKTH